MGVVALSTGAGPGVGQELVWSPLWLFGWLPPDEVSEAAFLDPLSVPPGVLLE